MSEFKIVTEDKKFKVINYCPYCKGDLTYVAEGWEKDENGLWKVDSMDCSCSNEPLDCSTDEWEGWFQIHCIDVLQIQRPKDRIILEFINKKYRFKL